MKEWSGLFIHCSSVLLFTAPPKYKYKSVELVHLPVKWLKLKPTLRAVKPGSSVCGEVSERGGKVCAKPTGYVGLLGGWDAIYQYKVEVGAASNMIAFRKNVHE